MEEDVQRRSDVELVQRFLKSLGDCCLPRTRRPIQEDDMTCLNPLFDLASHSDRIGPKESLTGGALRVLTRPGPSQ